MILSLTYDNAGKPWGVIVDDYHYPLEELRTIIAHGPAADKYIAIQRAVIRALSRRNEELVMQAQVVARAYQQQQARLEWLDKQLAREQAKSGPWTVKEGVK